MRARCSRVAYVDCEGSRFSVLVVQVLGKYMNLLVEYSDPWSMKTVHPEIYTFRRELDHSFM